jgi:hypothetical protein
MAAPRCQRKASGNQEVFELARRAELLSNGNDVTGEQRHYRQALNPYLSPTAVAREFAGVSLKVHLDREGNRKQLPATFTPGPRVGPGLAESIERLQGVCDEQRIAEPVTRHRQAASLEE